LICMKNLFLLSLGILTWDCAALAQEAKVEPRVQVQFAADQSENLPEKITLRPHRFWDKKNDWLFAGVGAGRTLDYFSTLNMRRRGRQEILLTNGVVDNHPAFAAIEAAGTGASIGVAYLLHRYNHHKVERWTSAVHFALATSGAVRNYCLMTVHPPAFP
jgi:hypothetical protein